MEFLGLIVLFGAVALLWRRVSDLEYRHERLLDYVSDIAHRQIARAPEIELREGVVEPPAVGKEPAEPEPEPEPQAEFQPAWREELPEPTLEPVSAPAAMAGEPGEAEVEEARPRFRFDFEELFGRTLPIWAGGITLAVAGFFIVRYTIEAGLLTPEVRVLLGFLFGFALLGGAELAYRFEQRVADERVRQALSGAGLATLYASVYLAGSHYGLIGTGVAFLGLAAVTAGAIGLSYRFGLPSAVLGLVGGFAAPMLVESAQPNIPLLTMYLALVTGGLMLTAQRRRWAWLGLAALGGGLGWGSLLLISGIVGSADLLAMGGYLVVLGVVLPAFALAKDTKPHPIVDAIAAVIATLQMTVLVEQGGYSMLAWGLYLLLAAALAFLGWSNVQLRRASAVASLLGLSLLAAWPSPELASYAGVAIAQVGVLAGVPLALIWRGSRVPLDMVQLCGVSLGIIAVTTGQFADWEQATQPGLAAFAAGLAALPALATLKLWPAPEEQAGPQLLGAFASAALALFVAGQFAVSLWAAPLAAVAIALSLVALVRSREDRGLFAIAWIAAISTLVTFFYSSQSDGELFRLFGLETGIFGDSLPAVTFKDPLRWFAPLAGFAALAWFEFRHIGKAIAEVFAAICLYGVLAQLLPADALAWTMALLAVVLAWLLSERRAAWIASLAIAAGWAAMPTVNWVIEGAFSLTGEPNLIVGSLTIRTLLLKLAPVLAAGSALAWRYCTEGGEWAKRGIATLAALGLVTIHILFKHVLALEDMTEFVRFGLLERTLWEALLLALAYGCISQRARFPRMGAAGWALAILALAHFWVFTFLLHNPLWGEQQVGPTPIANLLVPAYGIAIGTLVVLRRALPEDLRGARIAADGAVMVLGVVLALSLLRQVYAGTILVGTPMLQSEDMARSLVGIVLAIAYLLWGARKGLRSWRVGSLVLMLVAVLKVFLLDAAALEGLARIASFVALGFSLIGIGWFYSRQLKLR